MCIAANERVSLSEMHLLARYRTTRYGDMIRAVRSGGTATTPQAEAASRLRRGEAPARIQQRLRRKGVAAPQVQEAMASAMHDDAFDEEAACRAAAEKRARSLDATDPVAARRKLQGFLLRRGFAAGIAARVARSVLESRRAE